MAFARPEFHARRQGTVSSMHWQTRAGYLYTLEESTTLQPPWLPSSLTITVDASGAASCPLPIADSRHFYQLGITIAP